GAQKGSRQFSQRPGQRVPATRREAIRRAVSPCRHDRGPATRDRVLGRQQRRHREGPHHLRQDRRRGPLRAGHPQQAPDQRLLARSLPDWRRPRTPVAGCRGGRAARGDRGRL
ncbi:MAG: LSU ribosomal protein L27p, partial [uncultured Thermomicrobiales bacterium]